MTDDPRPHHCIKCGRQIGPDESICEVCNRAGMVAPSASQYHGTMVVAIIAGVALLAIWASLSMRGVGPYGAEVLSVTFEPPNAALVTFEVGNQGTGRGFANCRVVVLDAAGHRLRTRSVTAGPLDGGETRTFTERVSGVVSEPDSAVIECR
ncbi:MAG TPA: hypothetical protein VFH63_10810 [candidate division Zixibacteria bacterium]|nr:hypothetical protein [candidate division Zixibacteria bacterium]